MTARINICVATLLGVFGAASAAHAQNVQIPFANNGGIRNWQADGDKVIYVQGNGPQWYKAELLTRCTGLNFAEQVGFETETSGAFNKFSSIVVEGRKCPVSTFEVSDKPPTKKEKAAAREKAASGN